MLKITTIGLSLLCAACSNVPNHDMNSIYYETAAKDVFAHAKVVAEVTCKGNVYTWKAIAYPSYEPFKLHWDITYFCTVTNDIMPTYEIVQNF